jgi:uncharacterized protein YebE (UPF0316 family)
MKIAIKIGIYMLIYVIILYFVLPDLLNFNNDLKVCLGFILGILVVMLFRIPRLFINKSKKLKK